MGSGKGKANSIYEMLQNTALEQANVAGEELDLLMGDVPEFQIPEAFQENVDLAQESYDEYGRPVAFAEQQYKQGLSAAEEAMMSRELARTQQTDISARQALGQRTYGGNMDKYNQMRTEFGVQRAASKKTGFESYLKSLTGQQSALTNLQSAKSTQGLQEQQKYSWETLEPWTYKRDLAASSGAAAWGAYYDMMSQQAGANMESYNTGMGTAGDLMGMVTMKIIIGSCLPEGTHIDILNSSIAIEDIKVGDIITGYEGKPVKVLQKHEYLHNPEKDIFYRITFKNNRVVNCSAEHKIEDIPAQDIDREDIISKETYKGVEISYDIITQDKGYQINSIPVNSMIDENIAEGKKIGLFPKKEKRIFSKIRKGLWITSNFNKIPEEAITYTIIN